MINASINPATSVSQSRWHALAAQVLDGHHLDRDEARAVLDSPDEELLDLLAAAYRVRHRAFGNTVQLFFLMNAKSGLCPEDCGYCSQSKVSEAEIPKYNLLSAPKLLEAARMAAAQNSKTFCIVISARGPTQREMDAVCEIVPKIKQEHDLNICACLGLLTPEQAKRLADAGVDKVNHNLNTSSRYYAEICTTHTYDDRVATLAACREAGLSLCSGGIIGMGEELDDVVSMALELRELKVESIPLNFLNAIDGTPLERTSALTPRDCLRALAMMRLVNPTAEIRIAGGRELHLRSLQPLGLYPANSMFVGDYLTTKGQLPEADEAMIHDLGFVITKGSEAAEPPACLNEA
ncbi:biotin synthase BioB [bacterium]|jgi:biotin synthase|nr:biotin synthase BioB [Pirellulales bacterium]NBP80328.1 biotin synthase BioB [bacterium]